MTIVDRIRIAARDYEIKNGRKAVWVILSSPLKVELFQFIDEHAKYSTYTTSYSRPMILGLRIANSTGLEENVLEVVG